MKLQRSLFIMLTGLCSLQLSAQLQRIVLQGTGEPQVFSELDDALAAAQPDDRLYFSGGSFTTALASQGFELNFPIHFIGAGIDPDSSSVTGVTTIRTAGTYDLIITTGASGSTFTGIKFQPDGSVRYGTDLNNDAPQNVVFERCEFDCGVYLGRDEDVPASSSAFNECIFRDFVLGVGPAPTSFTRCIFDLFASGGPTIATFRPSGLTMDHCVVLHGPVANCQGMVIKNSIFTKDNGVPISQSTGTVTNCMISNTVLYAIESTITSSNITTAVNASTIFVDETDGDHQYSDDFHLAPGSSGTNAGDDGTDIGIYGSASPYKDGSVPLNPHYRQATVGASTVANGDLPVSILIEAQPN